MTDSIKHHRKRFNLNESDQSFIDEVLETPGGEKLRRCFACGTCVASCPVRRVESKYNPRRIIRQALLGLREETLRDDFIWLCSTCHTCHERCPQGVRVPDVMTALRNVAARHGRAHPSFVKQAELIKQFGRLYEVEAFDNKKRAKLGLPALPGRCEAVSEIVEKSGLASVVERKQSDDK